MDITKKTQESSKKDLIIFTHIPKTAGTSLRHILMQQYGKDSVFMFYDDPAVTTKNAEELLEELRSHLLNVTEIEDCTTNKSVEIRAISGHKAFGLHDLLPTNNFHYITLLREPIERVISFYYHIYGRSEQAFSIESLISCKASIEFDNLQVRMLSGVGWKIPYGQCSYSLLEKAKHNLLHYYTFGIQDRFAETLETFSQVLGWSNIKMVIENVGKGKETNSNISQQALNLIAENNCLDLELYKFAQQLFEERRKIHDLQDSDKLSERRQATQNSECGTISQIQEEHLLDILEVFKFTATSKDVLVSFAIDAPQPNTKVDPSSVIIGGWVIGKKSRVTKVEFIFEDRVIQKTAVNGSRPDVAQVFPQEPTANNCGFTAQVAFIGMPSEAKILIQAIFEDESCIPIGLVRFLQKPLNPCYEATLSETKKELQQFQIQVQQIELDVKRSQAQLNQIEADLKV